MFATLLFLVGFFVLVIIISMICWIREPSDKEEGYEADTYKPEKDKDGWHGK